MVHHYVMLKFKENTLADHISAFVSKMFVLSHHIDVVESISIGLDELKETRSWDLILDMRFAATRTCKLTGSIPNISR